MLKERLFVVFSTVLMGTIILIPSGSPYKYIRATSIVLPSSVHSLSYSPEGDFLAVSCGRDGDDDARYEEGGLAIISTGSWRIVKTLEGHDDWEVRVAWRPQGGMLATASQDGTVRIWNTSSWETEKLFIVPQSVPLCPTDSVAFAWSSDGQRFAVSINDQVVSVYEASSGSILETLVGHSKYVATLAWSPDGNYIVSGSWDLSAIVWNASSFELVKRLEAGAVRAVAWSPGGRFLATASHGSREKLRIWDSRGWELVKDVHMSFGISLSWSPDGAKLVAARWEATVLIWNARTWEVTHTVRNEYGVRVVQWSPNGGELASGMIARNGMVSIWHEKAL